MSLREFILRRVRSVGYAAQGLLLVIRTQHSIWIQLSVSLLVIALGFYLQLTRYEWMAVILSLGMVLTAEAMNTAVEFVANAVTLEHHPTIGQAKDAAAGAVFLAVIIAAIVGLLIFLPKLCPG